GADTRSARALAGFFSLAQIDAANFAAHRSGQLVNELDLAWILVGRGGAFAMLLELAHHRFAALGAGFEADKRLDERTAIGIGARHHRRFHDRRMFEQNAFDLERSNPIAGRDDNVVGATDEPQIAVAIAPREVAGEVPIATKRRGGLLGIFPVLQKQRWRTLGARADRKFADLVFGGFATVRPEHAQVVARKRTAHRTRLDFHPG